MNRIEIFSSIPQEPRNLIRAFIAHREDALLIKDSRLESVVACCEDMIRGLLSLYLPEAELDYAYSTLME